MRVSFMKLPVLIYEDIFKICFKRIVYKIDGIFF